jgi:hypothetical protein
MFILIPDSATITWVNMTVFITHFWKSVQFELNGPWRTGFWLRALLVCACMVATLAMPVKAQTPNGSGVEVTELRLEKSESALVLQSSLRLDLSSVVEDALQKGMPLYFVTEAEITRDRWYWSDKKISTVARHFRLAYQPLTRLWRLNVSREPIGSVGLTSSLSQNFETLSEALDAIRRTVNWKLADLSDVDSDNKYTLMFKFRLDVSQLARPFQMTAGNNAEWNLATQKTLRFTSDIAR